MFKGCFVAVVTPFLSGKVDFESYKRVLDWVLDNGVDGIVACGTTGESLSLLDEEKKELAEFTVRYVNKRVPVVMVVSAVSTMEVLGQMEALHVDGLDAWMVCCPYYVKPTQDGLFWHFRAVAENTSLPVIIYNNPGRSAVDISASTLERLMVFNNIKAIKEASPDLTKITTYKQRLRSDFSVLAGNDDTLAAALAMGASGVISSTANVTPKLFSELIKCWNNKDYTALEKRRDRLVATCKALYVEPNPIAVKYALSLLGLVKDELRLPLTSLSEANKNGVRCALQSLGLVV